MLTRVAESPYRFRGDVWGSTVLFPSRRPSTADQLIGERLDLHAARLALEGAYRLSDDTNWFAEGEQWAASRGDERRLALGRRVDFHSGLSAGGALGLGYEIPKLLRVALGVSLHTWLDEAKLDLGPFFSLRWRPVDRITAALARARPPGRGRSQARPTSST